MADISQYLQAIESAVYGEDVRGAIHDAIEIMNLVGAKTLSTGTAVTSASSSVEGYYKDSLYYNTSTYDLWKCTGTAWQNIGNLKGAKGDKGDKGDKGNTGTAAGFGTPTATVDANIGTPSVNITASGADTAKVFSFAFHNLKGQKGDTGQTGATGNGIASITKTGTSGLVDTYTITMTNGATATFTVTNGSDAIYDSLGLSVVDGKLCITYNE
ncbi:MAG: hypothetical protein IJT37_10195 [Lachnospiraceae bacterium]|nr:hypothetical protein [Lachnospiraceae bacterium]